MSATSCCIHFANVSFSSLIRLLSLTTQNTQTCWKVSLKPCTILFIYFSFNFSPYIYFSFVRINYNVALRLLALVFCDWFIFNFFFHISHWTTKTHKCNAKNTVFFLHWMTCIWIVVYCFFCRFVYIFERFSWLTELFIFAACVEICILNVFYGFIYNDFFSLSVGTI